MARLEFPWKPVLRLEKNLKGRDFVCGDIHGCFDDLEYHLQKREFNVHKDRLFCTGDLIDRGPESIKAPGYLRQKWFYSVLGNHEQMLYEFFTRYGSDFYAYDYQNGSEWARKQPLSYLESLTHEIQKLPLIIQIENTLILHAALPAVTSLETIEKNPQNYLETIIWDRNPPRPIKIPGINRVYCGHSIIDEIGEYRGTVNLDTGCFLKYYGSPGRLTLVPLMYIPPPV